MTTTTDAPVWPTLGEFEGSPVVQSGIEIPSAGGGFHDSLAVLPESWTEGTVIDVVMRCKVGKVRFEPAKPASGDPELPEAAMRRVHVLAPLVAAVDNGAVCADLIADTEARVEQLRDERRERADAAREAEKARRKREREDAKNGVTRTQMDGEMSFDDLTAEERAIAETFGNGSK
jgi:hypothetical protein